MPFASNSGTRLGAGDASPLRAVTVASIPPPPADQSGGPLVFLLCHLVERDAEDDDDPDEQVEVKARQLRHDDDVLDQTEHAGAEADADHGATSAGKRDAAHDADGHRLELHEGLGFGGAGIDPRHAEKAPRGREDGRKKTTTNYAAPGVHTAG